MKIKGYDGLFSVKFFVLLSLCLFLFSIVLSGCSSSSESSSGHADASVEEASPLPYTFTDDLGREVTVTRIDRTAALLGSYADVWMLAGGSICASADDAWDDFGLPLAEDTVNLGSMKKLSLENLLASSPDLVLASTSVSQHLEWEKTLEDAGLCVAYFDVSNFSDYLRMLKVCTDLTGHPEIYESQGTALETRIQETLKRNTSKESPKVLLLRAAASFVRVKNSEDTVLGQMLKDFGCQNIADSEESLLETLSIESIYLQNPDRIFILSHGDNEEEIRKQVTDLFAENPLWSELNAMKEDKVFFMDKQLYSFKPNARWAEAYEKLETMIYD